MRTRLNIWIKLLFILIVFWGIMIIGGKKVQAAVPNIDVYNKKTYEATENLPTKINFNHTITGIGTHTFICSRTSVDKSRTCTTEGKYTYKGKNKINVHGTYLTYELTLSVTWKAYGSHAPIEDYHKDATCTAQGSIYYKCVRCGRQTGVTTLPALGHNWMEFENIKPTCGERGYVIQKCERCEIKRDATPGSSQGSTYAPTGRHNYVNGICSVCGAKSGSGESSGGSTSESTTVHYHIWKDAECDEPKTCTTCGATEGTALGHNYVNGVCVRCGELKTEGVLNEWDLTGNGLVTGNTKALLREDGTLEITGEGAICDFAKPNTLNAEYLNPITGRNRIKSVHITGKIRNIGTYLFYYFTNIEEIVIDHPETIERIGEGAFFGCVKLKSFTIPKNVTEIGARTFCHCHDLKILDFSQAPGLVRIGHEVARDCWSLQDVILLEGLKVIGYEAFFNCMSLKNIIIPSTVNAIGTKGISQDETGIGISSQLTDEEKEYGNTIGYNNVFSIDFSRNVGQEEYKSYIQMVLAKNNISFNEENAIEKLSELLTETKVWYYSSNKVLETYAQQKASNEMKISPLSWDISTNQDKSIIAELDPQGKLTVLGIGETKDYQQGQIPWNSIRARIKSIEISEGITSIGEFLFYWHELLQQVNLPTTIEKIKFGAFFGDLALSEITIPDKVTFIGGRAFCHCESLTSITLPSGITVLNGETFRDCYKLRTVELLGDVTSMGKMELFNCPSLTSFTVSPYISYIEEDIFKIDFSQNVDTRYESVKNLTPCKIEYYSVSNVMKEYVKDNTERTFEVKDIEGIEIKTNPSKLNYVKGDTLDTEKLVLIASYYNDSTKDSKLTKEITQGFTCTPEKLETVGTQKVVVTYGGKTTSFNVQVTDVEVTDIFIKEGPIKTVYYIGDTLNTAGLTLMVIYNNGISEEVSTGFTCTPINLETEGTQEIKVTYEEKTTSFIVTVKQVEDPAKKITSIAVKTLPNKLEYNVGDTLDTTGMLLTVTYSDGTTKDITSGYECTPTTLTPAGKLKIQVTYEGKTAEFEVTVKEKDNNNDTNIDNKDNNNGNTNNDNSGNNTNNNNNGSTNNSNNKPNTSNSILNTDGKVDGKMPQLGESIIIKIAIAVSIIICVVVYRSYRKLKEIK